MDVSWHSSDEEKNRIRIHIKSLKNALCQQHNKVEQLQQYNKKLKGENKALREENENLKKTIDTLSCQIEKYTAMLFKKNKQASSAESKDKPSSAENLPPS